MKEIGLWLLGVALIGFWGWSLLHTESPADSKSMPEQADYNCSDFSSHQQAQAFFEAHDPSADPYGLDRDKDGSACELL